MAGYHKGTPELRERAYQTLLAHGGAMQNHELAKLALREAWPIHHTKMWGTHGLLNTLCEEGRVVRISRGRYAVMDHPDARTNGGWIAARLRILSGTRRTVAASGTVSRRWAKDKQLRARDLLATLDDLALKQAYRCAQTGVPFDEADPDLRASLDRRRTSSRNGLDQDISFFKGGAMMKTPPYRAIRQGQKAGERRFRQARW